MEERGQLFYPGESVHLSQPSRGLISNLHARLVTPSVGGIALGLMPSVPVLGRFSLLLPVRKASPWGQTPPCSLSVPHSPYWNWSLSVLSISFDRTLFLS